MHRVLFAAGLMFTSCSRPPVAAVDWSASPGSTPDIAIVDHPHVSRRDKGVTSDQPGQPDNSTLPDQPSTCLPDGSNCKFSDQCCNHLCLVDAASSTGFRCKATCIPLGSGVCTTDADCCSPGNCQGGVCQQGGTCVQPGMPCQVSADCCPTAPFCVGGKCVNPA